MNVPEGGCGGEVLAGTFMKLGNDSLGPPWHLAPSVRPPAHSNEQ